MGGSAMTRLSTYVMVLLAVGFTSACTSLPYRLHDTGVRLEPTSSDGADIRSVGFWTDDTQILLRGEVIANRNESRSLSGHVDVAITVPDGSNTVCTVAPLEDKRQSPVNTYSRRFESIPPEGSRIRVSYHASPSHPDCAR